MTKVLTAIKKPILVTLMMLFICGLAYPLLLTGISQLVFPKQANGSLISINGQAVGSALEGQDFTDGRFMKCRPSAVNYNTYTATDQADGNYTGPSSGSKNYGPTNPELADRVEQDMNVFLSKNPTIQKEEIPADLLSASGSGLDPHISPESATIQIPELSETTGLSEARLNEIISENTQEKYLGIFGEASVNVLKVNLQIAKDLNLV